MTRSKQAIFSVLKFTAVILLWLSATNPVTAQSYSVFGIDVSHHQGKIDWSLVKEAGVDFVFIKASEGGNFRDRLFSENWRGVKAAGLNWGAYHFFSFCRPGLVQAENFLTALPQAVEMLPPVIDVEFVGNCKNPPDIAVIRQELTAMLKQVEAVTGRRPIIYQTINSWQKILRGHFDDYPVWLRSIGKEPDLKKHPPWQFWQYSQTGKVKGISGNVDLNYFKSSKAELQKLLSVGQ